MLRRTTIHTTLALALLLPLAFAGHGPAAGHFYGNGHADITWTTTTIPPSVDGTGTGHLTTNLPTAGQAIAFGMPLTHVEMHVLPATTATPVRGVMIMNIPANTDPWWSTYGGGVPPGITSGGTIEFTLAGNAEHHPNAVTLHGTFTVTATTGQYAGLISTGDWSGSTTGGSTSFGPHWDFVVIGRFA